MAGVARGPRIVTGSWDENGHREYKVKVLVQTELTDGPAAAMTATGLYAIGQLYAIGTDADTYAYCWPDRDASPHKTPEGGRGKWWVVNQRFSTKPLCAVQNIENPLLEPQKVSGSWVKESKEAVRDRNDELILSSSHEQLRGKHVEFDDNHPTVKIEQNVADLGLATFAPMVNTLNDATLWGLAARCWKLSNVEWEMKWYAACSFYFTRAFTFEGNPDTWDRDVLDEGTKVLNGHWEGGTWTLDDIDGLPPDRDNPKHFIRYKDKKNENSKVILNGYGEPAETRVWDWITGTGTATGSAGMIHVERYSESNFLTLGIPSALDDTSGYGTAF